MKRKHFLFILKYALAAILLYYVLRQIDFTAFAGYIKKMSLWAALGAFVAFNIGQIICAERMRYYYAKAGQPLERKFAWISYYVGIFYNLVFPGGVGGDAYRVYLFKKVANLPVGQGIRIQLANRLNGLLVMSLMILLAAAFVDVGIDRTLYWSGLLATAIIGTGCYFLLMKLFIKEEAASAWGAMLYSLSAQLCGLVTFALIWVSLSHGEGFAAYVVLFLTALIVSMIPITIGGLGIREFVFLHGAEWLNHYAHLGLSPEMGVAFSLSFFAVTVATAVIGLLLVGSVKKPIH